MSATRSAISRATWASRNSRAADLVREARAPRAQQFAVEQEAFVAHGPTAVSSFVPGRLRGLSWRSMPIGEAELGLEATAAPALARAAARAMRSDARRAADFLLPPVCISCRTRIGSHGLLCGACFAKIDFIAPPLCDRLGVPLPFEAGETLLSAAAIASPPVYDRARAAARYSDTMRELIQSFKYRDRHEGLPLFARWLRRRAPSFSPTPISSCRCRSTLAALVAAVQPIGHACA